MKIVQLLPNMAFGDAISNNAIVIRNIIRSMGYPTEIYADIIDAKIKTESIFSFDHMFLSPNDVLIYHLSTGSRLNYLVEKFHCKKMMIYHNITPFSYFIGFSNQAYHNTKAGLKEVKYLRDKFDYCIADSEFNKQDLIDYAYTCAIDVLPIAIPFLDYEKKPSNKIIRKYSDGIVNLLFVGRVAPNKKHEDIIAMFYHYNKKYNPYSRLIFVGHWYGMEKYYEQLCEYIEALHLRNVVFTGHVEFDEILAYYKLADVFLCASEHEGFCVPLVEAMFFDVPIVAYPHAAVPGTLGQGGVLLDQISPLLGAGVINALMTEKDFRNHVVTKQQERLSDFRFEVVKSQFVQYLSRFLERTV